MSEASYSRIYSETSSQIDRHLARVKEGRDVDAACFFARWLFWSGIPGLLKENSTPHGTPSPLKCDGAFLSWKLNELIEACNEYYRTNKPAGLQATELESLREKVEKLTTNLDLVAGQLSRLVDAINSKPEPQFEGARAGGVATATFPALPLPCQCVTTRTSEEIPKRINGFENEQNPIIAVGSYHHETEKSET